MELNDEPKSLKTFNVSNRQAFTQISFPTKVCSFVIDKFNYTKLLINYTLNV